MANIVSHESRNINDELSGLLSSPLWRNVAFNSSKPTPDLLKIHRDDELGKGGEGFEKERGFSRNFLLFFFENLFDPRKLLSC